MNGLRLRYLVTAFAAVIPIWGAQTQDGLTASAEITTQRYCLGMPFGGFVLKPVPADAITLRLMLMLTYRNVSANPVIFIRDADEQVVISRSFGDADQHKNQTLIRFRGTRTPYTMEDRAYLESEQPQVPPFGVLPPNGVLRFAYDLGFQVHNPTEHGPELLGTKVFFQLDLNHALMPDQVVQDLEAKWHSIGTLWAETIRTQPIEINIPKSPKTSMCVSEFRID